MSDSSDENGACMTPERTQTPPAYMVAPFLEAVVILVGAIAAQPFRH